MDYFTYFEAIIGFRTGMKITAGHRPKSARLAVHFSLDRSLWPDKMCACACNNLIIPTCKKCRVIKMATSSQTEDSGGIELERRLENEAVEKASVKGHFPKVATDLRERASVYDVAT